MPERFLPRMKFRISENDSARTHIKKVKNFLRRQLIKRVRDENRNRFIRNFGQIVRENLRKNNRKAATMQILRNR